MAGGGAGPLHAPVEAARGEHPLQLVGEQEKGGDGGRVVGLVLTGVLERGRERQGGGLPAAVVAVELRDPRDRGRAEERQPEAAVGGEALLGGEVVRVRLRDVDRKAAGARGRIDQDERLTGVGGPHDVDHHAGGGLVVSPPDHVGLGVAHRNRRVAGLGLHQDRLGQEGGAGGRPWRTWSRTRRRSGAADARAPGRRRPRPRTPWCRRCRARPRSRPGRGTAPRAPSGRGRRAP